MTDITKAAKETIKPGNMIWIVVGDQSKIETGIKELGYKIKIINSEAKEI